MRGTHWWSCLSSSRKRFIPAHAGNTQNRRNRRRPFPVHPRACGEHSRRTQNSGGPSGSSPRMRGTPSSAAGAGIRRRFIPAHAGNTHETVLQKQLRAVHPRACGEHGSAKLYTVNSTGSSPRMRGTPAQGVPRRRHRRFIPAHAGNTGKNLVITKPVTVHPRACGEHLTR